MSESKKIRARRRELFLLLPLLFFFSCAKGSKKEAKMPGMALGSQTKSRGGESPAKEKSGGKKILYWYDPMMPNYKSDHPGKSPMGMDMIPKYAEEEEGKGGITVSSTTQQLIGVQFASVRELPVARKIRTVGRVEVDESKLFTVHTKFEGWIEKLFVERTGDFVRRGTPLFQIYSPQLVSTQEELLLAKRATRTLETSTYSEIRESSFRTLQAARRRLRLFDISEREIRQIESSGKVLKSLTIFAPASGYVFEKMALEGMQVVPGMALYKLADLSTVWILGDLYEEDLPFVKPGQRAVATLNAYPGRKWVGKVSFVYPYLQEKTRTNQVRIQFRNPRGILKPGMYANVEISIPQGVRLVVPETAIVETGERQLVFVKSGKKRFEPREVVAGVSFDGKREVLQGLRAGEEVVTSANFLLDSESRLKEALQSMGSGQKSAQGVGSDRKNH